MKLLHSFLCLLFCQGPVFADWQIVQKGEHKDQEEPITISIRDTLVRYERPEKKIGWLTDISTGDTIVFLHEAKAYQRFALSDVIRKREEMVKSNSPVMRETGGKVVAAGGKSDDVAGWKTSLQNWEHPVGLKMKLWVSKTPEAKKLGDILQKAEDANPLAAPLLPNTPRHSDFGGMIMRYEITSAKGSTGKNTTTSVKEEKLDASLFQVPSEYREITGKP
jgi:hypothetical protein